MMDHHCIWLNNCVGLNNARWFLGFLMSFSAVCMYGAYVLGAAMMELRHRSGLADMMVRSEETGQMVRLSFKSSLLILLDYNSLLAVLTVLILLLVPIITLFTGYQLRIVMLGYTTNEESKWLNVAAAIDDEVLFFVKTDKEGVCMETLEVVEKEDQPGDAREKVLVTNLSQVKNIYDLGPWANFKLLLFPQTPQKPKIR
ncbi:palmitoyltransferase swf1 [Dipsacomyces acuminosporus]|nr:palmitoyltransferase swf1 [Dipsacomyces acuminosporus]